MKVPYMPQAKTIMWETPQDFFDKCNDEFHFDIDVCATPENAKVKTFFTPQIDGLSQNWGGYKTIWCNPPYGKEMPKWIKKAYETWKECNNTIVMLIPSRTDTKAFHEYIYHNAEIRFIKGRLKFGGSNNAAPFASMLVIFRGNNEKEIK